MTNRTILPLEPFAKDAETILVGAPIAGQSYRNEALSDQNKGWGFQEVVESQNFNQTMYLTTSLIKQLSDQGILDFSEVIDYSKGSVIKFNDSCFIALDTTTAGESPLNSGKWLDLSRSGSVKWSGKVRAGSFFALADIFSENQYFSGILRLTVKRIDDTPIAITLAISAAFSDDAAATVASPRATCVQLGCYNPVPQTQFRSIRYTDDKDTLELNLSTLLGSNEIDVECEMVVLSGDITTIADLTIAQTMDNNDPRTSFKIFPTNSGISVNGETVYTKSTIPTASASQKGIVQLADSLSDPDTFAVSLNLYKNQAPINAFAADAIYSDVRTQRAVSVPYTNTTGNLIQVKVWAYRAGSSSVITVFVDGVQVDSVNVVGDGGYGRVSNSTFLVKAGSTYRVEGNFLPTEARSGWVEFRSASARVASKDAIDQFYYSVDGKIFEAFDEKLSDEELKEKSYTLMHLTYDEFVKVKEDVVEVE